MSALLFVAESLYSCLFLAQRTRCLWSKCKRVDPLYANCFSTRENLSQNLGTFKFYPGFETWTSLISNNTSIDTTRYFAGDNQRKVSTMIKV